MNPHATTAWRGINRIWDRVDGTAALSASSHTRMRARRSAGYRSVLEACTRLFAPHPPPRLAPRRYGPPGAVQAHANFTDGVRLRAPSLPERRRFRALVRLVGVVAALWCRHRVTFTHTQLRACEMAAATAAGSIATTALAIALAACALRLYTGWIRPDRTVVHHDTDGGDGTTSDPMAPVRPLPLRRRAIAGGDGGANRRGVDEDTVHLQPATIETVAGGGRTV